MVVIVVMVMMAMIFIRRLYIEMRRCDPAFVSRLTLEIIFIGYSEFLQFFFDLGKRYAAVDERTKQHIAADARKTV